MLTALTPIATRDASEPPPEPRILVAHGTERRPRLGPLRNAVTWAVRRHGCPACTVSVVLIDDEAMRDLNHAHRGFDAPTDVLSWPAGPHSGELLGDIAISVETADRQARRRGVTLSQEVAALAVHGVLHLLGFEDRTEAERAAMWAAMNEVFLATGLPEEPRWVSTDGGEA